MTIQLKCLVCGKETDANSRIEPRICEEHWHCPKCGVGVEYNNDSDPIQSSPQEGFVIDYRLSDANSLVTCGNCKRHRRLHTWTPREVEQAILKKLGSLMKVTGKKDRELPRVMMPETVEPLRHKRYDTDGVDKLWLLEEKIDELVKAHNTLLEFVLTRTEFILEKLG
jgi:hypothetical protein